MDAHRCPFAHTMQPTSDSIKKDNRSAKLEISGFKASKPQIHARDLIVYSKNKRNNN